MKILCKIVFVSLVLLVVNNVSASSVTLPTPEYQTSDTLTADGLNTRFNNVKAAVDENSSRVDEIVGNPCANQNTFITGYEINGKPICASPSIGSGYITEVNTPAGSGLAGGNTTGAITLGIDPAVVQKRLTNSCGASEHLQGIGVNGNPTCTPDKDSLVELGLFCADGDVAKFATGQWQCAADLDTQNTYAAGTGILISGTTISLESVTDGYSIPGVEFLPAFTSTPASWGRYDLSGYGFPKTDARTYTTASVHLPSGAAINNVHCYFYDNNTTYDIISYNFSLRSSTFSTGARLIIASASGTATTAASTTMIDVADTDITPPHTVNNSTQSYHIIVVIKASIGFAATSSSRLRLYGCTINYTR